MKIFLTIISLSIILFSLTYKDKTKSSDIERIQLGDCFQFTSDKLIDFGLILINKHGIDGVTELGFAPVKFNKESIGNFELGQVYIQKYMDYSENKEIYGMSVFLIKGNDELKGLLRIVKKGDKRILRRSYANVTGGTISLSKREFKKTLSKWETIFGKNAELTNLNIVSSVLYDKDFQKSISDCLKEYHIHDLSSEIVYSAIECLNEKGISPSVIKPSSHSLIYQMEPNYPVESRKLWMLSKNIDEGKISLRAK